LLSMAQNEGAERTTSVCEWRDPRCVQLNGLLFFSVFFFLFTELAAEPTKRLQVR